MMNLKTCSHCKRELETSEFSKSTYTKSGLQSWCKSCKTELSCQYGKNNKEGRKKISEKYYKTHKESINQKNKDFRKNNPEKYKAANSAYYQKNKKTLIQKTKDWYVKNKERIAEYGKKYREQNKEIIRKKRSLYYQSNKETKRASNQRRRANKRGCFGSFTKEEFVELCNKYGNKCLMCGEVKPLSADHIIPISAGGENTIKNIQPLCVSCNSKKHTKILDFRY